jgi:hypothetical protein
MIFLKNGCGFMPKPNVCVRDTKVRKFSGFGVLVEKKRLDILFLALEGSYY